RSYRYASHAAVLLIAAAMSSYGAANLALASRPGPITAQAAAEGSQFGDVVLGRDSTIIKPISIPTAALPDRRPIRYTVKAGDTPAGLAAQYGVDVTTILGFNSLRASDLTPGLVLVIPVDPQTGPNLSTGAPADPIVPGALVCPIQGAPIIQKFGPTSFALEPP